MEREGDSVRDDERVGCGEALVDTRAVVPVPAATGAVEEVAASSGTGYLEWAGVGGVGVGGIRLFCENSLKRWWSGSVYGVEFVLTWPRIGAGQQNTPKAEIKETIRPENGTGEAAPGGDYRAPGRCVLV